MISVLCVDDDAAHLSLEKQWLEEPGAITVTTALSAPEALRVMKTSRFDAVVSDYQMPGMDGIELLKEVRRVTPALPFILFTGTGREDVVIEAFNNGVDFYLRKTGDPDSQFARLKDTVKKAVKRGAVWKAFHDSETRYRQLFETAQDGILILDAESGEIRDANPFLLALLGYTIDDLRGKKLWEIGFIKDKAMAEQAAAVLKSTGYIRYEDLPLATKDGRVIEVEFVSNVYLVDNEKVIQCNIRDIADRKRAELVQSRLAAIVENSDAAIIGTTIDGIITSWNSGAGRIYGYSAQEIVGRNISLLVPPDLPDDTRISLDQIRNGSPAIRYETLRRKKDGSLINVYLIISPVKDAQNHLIGVSMIAHDITKRTQDEESLRESEKRYRGLFENMLEGFTYCRMLYDAKNHPCDVILLHANPAFNRIFSITGIVGTPVTAVFSGIRQVSPELFEIFGRVALNGDPESCEIFFKPSEKWLHISVYSPAKEHVVAFYEDITKRKTAEEAIRIIGEDLERKVADRTSDLTDINLNLMTEMDIRLDAEKQFTRLMGEKDVLLREVHHRVKNNLQIIISLLNLQSRYIKDETTLAAFRESQNRVRAMALVHEKLYQSTNLATLDLGDYLKFLGNNLFQFLGMNGKGITLTMDIHDIFLTIDTVIPIGLIINELISNSLKYAFPSGREGKISLAITRQDHTLTILFTDNGIGISKDFEWRNAESLGLRLVCSLVEQLDGTIELDRSSGTAFTIVVQEKV